MSGLLLGTFLGIFYVYLLHLCFLLAVLSINISLKLAFILPNKGIVTVVPQFLALLEDEVF